MQFSVMQVRTAHERINPPEQKGQPLVRLWGRVCTHTIYKMAGWEDVWQFSNIDQIIKRAHILLYSKESTF